MLNYNLFYKQFGIRRPIQLVNPIVSDINKFQFPRNSTWHYASHQPEITDVDTSLPYLAGLTKRTFTDYQKELTSNIGHGVKRSTPLLSLIKPFHIKHKTFKFTPDAVELNHDALALTLVNYGHLQETYKYPPMPISVYNKWWDIEKTMWDGVKKACNVNERNNFVFIDLPDTLPSVSLLNLYSERVNMSLIKYFDSPARLSVLELWKWISPTSRSKSALGDWTETELTRTTLVFWYKGYWAMIGLGNLDNWIKKEVASVTYNGAVFQFTQIQKYVLKLMMSVQSSGIIKEEVTLDEKTEEHPTDDDEGSDATGDSTSGTNTVLNKKDATAFTDPQKGVSELEVQYNEHTELTDTLSDIESDLAVLEKMAQLELHNKGINKTDLEDKSDKHLEVASADNAEAPVVHTVTVKSIIPKDELEQLIYQPKDPNSALTDLVHEYADYSMMTATEYKNTLKLVANSENIASPYNADVKLSEFSKIKPETLKINKENSVLKGSIGVMDSSMLESRLEVFDKDYIMHTLPKDITSMVHHIQTAGVIIQNYDIEKEASILGEYEMHTLRLKPINGVSSTLHFKIPVVDTNGSFCVAGNKYKMRKQRVDLPLRKIGSNEVALTSYYGKLLVNKCTRTFNDLGLWLFKQLYALAYAEEPTVVKSLGSADVFDNHLVSPSLFGKLSKCMKTLSVGGYNFNFSNLERLALFDPDFIEKLEAKGKYLLVGKSTKLEPILMDFNNDLYIYKNESYLPIGTIYSLSGLDANRAPNEFSTLKVFGKQIPIVVILGYYIGLRSVMTLLDVEYTEYPAGKRIELKPDEYTLTFQDKRLVLSRKNVKATMVLAGLNEFDKQLKEYPFEDFNNKDVYFNLLMAAKLSARYLDELNLLDKMFIDPITRDILVEMKEPSVFKGLLLRASELLTTEYHPDAQDMRYMRLRGYERVAGAIYKELVTSVRVFNNRNIRNKSAIELNPYAVWSAVVHDNANKLVADINPIEDLKQIEAITYNGTGGRDKQAMNKSSRVYHKNDVGVISESTVDSSDVGINTFTTANPLFNSVRGTVDRYDDSVDGPASVLSTSALISVAATQEDPRRVKN